MSDYAIASGLSQREINQIINSAQRYDKNPSVNHFTDDGIKSKIASLVWKSLPNSQKYSDLPTSEITKEEFEKRRLLEELADITKDLNQRLHKGFSKTAKTVAEVKNDKIIFNTNFERFSTAIAHAAEHDYKFILDSTEAGGGKSFEYGKIASSDETDTIIWLSNDHNNPSTETVKNNFVNVPPRTLENCHRANEFIVLSEKNINVYSEDKSENPICATCERLNQCKHFCGNGYGFLAQRKDAYSHKKIRQHPLQLPSPKQYDYSKTIFGIDEAEALLNPVKTINGYYTDLVLLMDDIEGKNPELYQSLQPLKSALKELLQNANNEPKYGFSDAQIREKLPQLPEEIAKLIDEYKTIISYDINQTVENIDYNQNFENLEEFQEIKQRTNEETARVASARLKALKGLPNNILLPFLEVLSGQRNGALRIQKGKLTVTIKDDRVSEILKTAKLVFLLDATADKSQLAKFLNISPDEILEIQQKPQPKDNLTIHNIQMEGLGSRHRSADCLQRIDKIKQQLLEIDPNAKFIGTKQSQWTDKNNKIRYKGDISKEETQTHGYYGRDHRGTNKFKGCQNLALFSLPFTNVGDAEAECLTLYGSLDNFEHYYHLKIKKEIKQTIARPRVQWHKDQEFNLYIFATDFDASWITDELGIRVVNSHVFDFCPEAGSISQRAKWQLIQVIKQLAQTGENIKNITQGLVGEILGKSQQAIQKVTRTFKGGFKGLVNHIKQKYNSPYLNNNRDGCNFNPELDDLFREWLGLDPLEAVQEFIDIIVNQGWEAFKAYINQVSGEIKYRIIGLLTPIFAPDIAKVILDSGG